MADFDAIIIGAGHNGLACAAFLSREGWRVLVIEQASEVGGGVRSDVQTLPGFCNDRYATNFSLFANSPAYTELRSEFDAHGVKFLRSDHPYASIHGAEAIRVFADGDRTEQSLARLNRSDASGWRELTAFYRRVGPSLGPLFSTELPSVAAVRRSAALVAGNRIGDTVKLARMLAQSSTEFARQFLSSPDAISILQAWGYHLDFPPEKAGGAMFAFVSAMSAAVHGMRLVEGGAGCISRALAAMIGENGGEVRTGCSVQEVVISRGRAVAVKTAAGDEISAGRAIVANVTTARIFGGLVEASKLPDRFVKRASAFQVWPGNVYHPSGAGTLTDMGCGVAISRIFLTSTSIPRRTTSAIPMLPAFRDCFRNGPCLS
ncbi:MAG: NAD(P)/FAD-dependent oxidoreductase [Bradyrhizobium sp.]